MYRIATVVCAFAALPAPASAYEAIATVVASVPIQETVNRPTQQCWTETAQIADPAPQPHNYVGAIIGGVAGGLLGSTIGRGDGRVVAGAIGAGVGAVTGDAIANRDPGTVTTVVPVQRCRQVDNFVPAITGYRVTYEYDGQRFSTRLPNDPGARLPVRVSVVPTQGLSTGSTSR